jgi:curved DNA-binding protein CbpA
MPHTLYELLEITATASAEEIKASYRKLAKKYHPDKNRGSTWHEERFKKINHAYQILSNPDKRRQYDQRLQYGASRTYQYQPPPSKPRRSSTPGYRPPRPGQHKAAPKYKRSTYNSSKTYLIAACILVVIGIAGAWFYSYMNSYSAREYFAKAESYYQQGFAHEAFHFYSKALSFDNSLSKAYERRGDILLSNTTNYKEALANYQQAIVNTPNPSDTLSFKEAQCLIKLRQYPEAIQKLNDALILNTQYDSALLYRAELHYHQEKYPLAITDYNNFLAPHEKKIKAQQQQYEYILPGFLSDDSKDAFLKRGYSFYQTQQFDKALQDFTTLLTDNPENGSLYHSMAIIYFHQKQHQKTCEALEQATYFGFDNINEQLRNYCSQ